MTLKNALNQLEKLEDLSAEESRKVFDAIFDGNVSEADIECLLVGLRTKGESVSEIQGAVTSMRDHMNKIAAPVGCIDIVGTGGDGHSTLNISTAASFVVAGCGVPVAKHGNRAASSLSGSSDVLSALGLNLDPSWDSLEAALNDHGIVFLFAPRHHPAMRHVSAVRKRLKTRTIFNLLGPLTNPACVKHHLIGVFDQAWSTPMALTLQALGSETAWITHGADAMDEISTTGLTNVVTLENGSINRCTIDPAKHAIPLVTLSDIQGGDAAFNAIAIQKLLAGEHSAYRDIVLLNSAAALVMCGKSATLDTALVLAAASIDSGAAKDKLEQLIRVTK